MTSSRWCPTPEQLMILEEMYKGGTRTPNATQIQQITARLSRYGKIEGKNVFYWFQNHKARDRQRLRRKLMSKQFHLHNHQQFPIGFLNLHPFSYYNPLGFFPQGYLSSIVQVVKEQSHQKFGQHGYQALLLPIREYLLMSLFQSSEVENGSTPVMGNSRCIMDSSDCMMKLDVAATVPINFSRPLKTLELFPITATGLKDESAPLKQNRQFPTQMH